MLVSRWFKRANKAYKITTGPLPENTDDIVVYMWNYKLKDMDLPLTRQKFLE